MTKNTKTLIYSAAGLLVLAAAVVVLLATQAPEEPKPPDNNNDDENLIFAEFKPSDVASVSVKNAEIEYTIKQISEEVFDIEELGAAPRHTDNLRNAARYMATFRARQIVEENAADFERYGLGEGAVEIVTVFKNGDRHEYLVGDRTPTTEDMSYVRKKGDDTVYAVWSYLVNFAGNDLRFFVSLAVTEGHQASGSPTVEKLSIQRKGQETYVIEEIPPAGDNDVLTSFNIYKVTSPIPFELNFFEADSIVLGLFDLRASEVFHLGEELPDDEITGFSEPTMLIEMTVNKEDVGLLIGNPVYEQLEGINGEREIITGYYGVFSAYPDVVYVFALDFLPWLNFDMERLMSSSFHMPQILHVGGLTIETPNHSMNFTFTGNSNEDEEYFLAGELVDTRHFKSLYQYVIAASAEQLFKGDADAVADMPLLARYTYSYRERFNRPDDTVEFRDSGDRRVVIVFNGEPRFTCRMMYITRLEQNLEAYLKGEEINISF